ncbi:SRB5 [Candida margitis]|uniref:SRB5 n=1 Tax=Candida margitis TaxID=1775924 RepID=UPI002227C333|nr:SRB5 [Candida margitis]KAI5950587.1 SRB5 [Candida margitis]
MVQQLSLASSIPHSNYLQTITSLQAITGILQPQDISTYSLITKPNHVFKPKFEPGKINQIEQYYMKCTTTWLDKKKGRLDIAKPIFNDDRSNPILVNKLFSSDDRNDEDGTERVWTLQISDIPIAGKNQTCSQQTIYESTLVHTHVGVDSGATRDETDDKMDIDVNMKEESDQPKQDIKKEETNLEKHEELPVKEEENTEDAIVIDEEPNTKDSHKDDNTNETTTVKTESQEANITTNPDTASATQSKSSTGKRKNDSFLIFLNDLGYEVVNQYWIKGVRFFYKDIIIEIYKVFIRDDGYDAGATDAIKLKLLDESNTFQIKCFVNVPKTTDIELINAGAKELSKLQEFVKNLFILEIPDRMFMDSRIQSLK